MKKKIILCTALVASLSFTSCVNEDLENLQNQIDELNEKVVDLEASQEQALLAAIAQMEATIQALSSTNAEQYATLLASYEAIQEEVAQNKNAVYYGSLLTDADYATFTAQGATIVTGKVTASTAEHVSALANVRVVGGNLDLTVFSDVTFENLETVGQHLDLSGSTDESSVSFPMLNSVGGAVYVNANEGLKSISADELVLVSSDLMITENPMMSSISFEKLAQVGGLNIEGEPGSDEDIMGPLRSFNIGMPNVNGSVSVMYVFGGMLNLGTIDGDLSVEHALFSEITSTTQSLSGLNLYNQGTSTLSFENLEEIVNNLRIEQAHYEFIDPDGGFGTWGTQASTSVFSEELENGMMEFPTFSSLEYIGGELNISGQGFDQLTTVDAFNKVLYLGGYNNNFQLKNANLESVNVFNALEELAQWGGIINVSVDANWFVGFNNLVNAQNTDIYMTLNPIQPKYDIGAGEDGLVYLEGVDYETAKLNAFNNLQSAKTLNLYAMEVTEVSAFSSLTSLNTFHWSTYLTLTLPMDSDLYSCSLGGLFDMVSNSDGSNISIAYKGESPNNPGLYVRLVVEDEVAFAQEKIAACDTAAE
ncbi:coiled-coil domain-containing 22 family protein [Sediminitomix flava]|uniref:DUF5689 domain-containing protein n=1 Tax=Sediminitomix flava TaxID=379075 RepID=A0A315Z5M6_SEDFL|nr:hypothetical protein [Sediminitomix flava]PWJ38577.1 hypothetical protein BC781_107167 [Sediminitomix flava]